MRRRLFLLLLLALPLAAAAEAREPQPLSFLASAEPAEVELGRPFRLRVEVRHHPWERYRLPEELSLGPVVVRRVEESRTEGEEVVETVFLVEALVFDALGAVELPEILLEAEDQGGPLAPLRIPAPTLRIRETGEGVELEPPPPPLPLRVFAWERLALVGGGLALLATLVVLVRRWRARRPVEEGPRPSPAEAARRALAALRAEALWEKGETRRHYFRLSEILRLYLRDAQGLAAVEMTSDELVAALRRQPIRGLDRERLEAWIRRGDLARFAKGEAGAGQALADWEELGAMIAEMEAQNAEAAGGGAA